MDGQDNQRPDHNGWVGRGPIYKGPVLPNRPLL